jgi:hypothetical protein
MTDAGDTAAAICPWCSAVLPNPDVERCPSCNAALTTGTEQSLPGLTALDAEAIIRAKTPTRQRSRLLSWFGGEAPDDNISPAEAGAIAPPDPAVKLEILKLQIASDIANLQAEAVSMQADAALEGRVLDIPDGTGLPEMAVAGDDTAAGAADAATEAATADGGDATGDTPA